jgi:putative tricarboxylic transport membrane protein
MDKRNWIGPTFLFGVGIIVLAESYRLGTGTLSSPQAGLFPFFAGAFLCLLSIVSFFSEIKLSSSLSRKGIPAPRDRITGLKVASILASLIVYSLLLDFLGFMLSTALTVLFWLKVVVPQRAFTAFGAAVFIPLIAYFLFHIWLRVALPKGVLPF